MLEVSHLKYLEVLHLISGEFGLDYKGGCTYMVLWDHSWPLGISLLLFPHPRCQATIFHSSQWLGKIFKERKKGRNPKGTQSWRSPWWHKWTIQILHFTVPALWCAWNLPGLLLQDPSTASTSISCHHHLHFRSPSYLHNPGTSSETL